MQLVRLAVVLPTFAFHRYSTLLVVGGILHPRPVLLVICTDKQREVRKKRQWHPADLSGAGSHESS